jgi:hypothetical protein
VPEKLSLAFAKVLFFSSENAVELFVEFCGIKIEFPEGVTEFFPNGN